MRCKSQLTIAGLLVFPFSFALPIPLIFKSIALIVFCATLILCGFQGFNASYYKQNKALLFLSIFYFTGIIITYLREGDLYLDEVRLSFLFLPAIIPLAPSLIRVNLNRILNAFVFGVLIYIIYAFLFLIYFYNWYAELKEFAPNYYLKYVLYHYLPGALHHTYLGMFLSFSILWILVKKNMNNVFRILLVFILLSVLPFLGSKFSLIVTTFIIVMWLFYSGNIKYKKWYLGGVALLTLAFIYLGIVTDLFRTFKVSFNKRRELFDCALQGFQRDWIYGLGKDRIKPWMSECTEERLFMDTHNIFLQELLGSGIISVIILILIFYHLYKNLNKDFFVRAYLGIILSYGIVEHIFNTQLGVTFFTFFSTILIIHSGGNQNKLRPESDLDFRKIN